MVSEELLRYVREQLAAGHSSGELRKLLLSSGGWSHQDIDEAFAAADREGAVPAPARLQARRPRRRWPRILVVAVVILVVAGAGIYAAFFRRPPDYAARIVRAVSAFQAEPSFSFAATTTEQLLSSASSTPKTSADFSFSAHGSVDRHDPAHPMENLALLGSLASTGATSTLSAGAALQLISLDPEAYVDLTDFDLSFSSSDAADAGEEISAGLAKSIAPSLENRWLEIPAASTTSAQIGADEPAFFSYVQSGTYIGMVQNAGVQNLEGVETTHLKITMQVDRQLAGILARLVGDEADLVAAGMGEALPAGTPAPSVISPAQTAELTDALVAMSGQEATVDVWIGKKDSLIYRIEVEPMTFVDPGSGATQTFSLQAAFSDYGSTFPATAPRNAEPLAQFLREMFGGLFGAPSVSSSTATASAPL